MTNESEAREELLALYENEERFLKQEIYKKDLYKLCELIGFHDLSAPAHHELCIDLMKTREVPRRLYLYPRGWMKTSIITQADTVMDILRNPNERILIVSSTGENVRKVLSVIKDSFWKNEEFRKIFPDYCPAEGTLEFGRQLDFSVLNRTNMTAKEKTVECASVGQTIVGRHYTKIKFSDIVTPETVATPNRIKQLKEWVAFTISLLEKPETDTITVEGTRYHFDDYYGHMIDESKKFKSRYHVVVKPAIMENGKALFPERFSLEALKAIQHDQGSWVFYGQYMLNPIDEESAPFKRSMLNYFPRAQIPRDPKERKFTFPVYMTIDPAISTARGSDWFVITIGMVTDDDDLLILDFRYGHWSIGSGILKERRKGMDDFADNFISLYQRYEPQFIGIETVAFQKMLIHVLDTIGREMGKTLPITEVKRGTAETKTKNMRIMSLVSRFEGHRIKFCDDLDKGFIEAQILRYQPGNRNNHDDLLDTIADIDFMKTIPGSPDKDYSKYPLKRRIEWLERNHDEEEEGVEMFMDDDVEEGWENEYYTHNTYQ